MSDRQRSDERTASPPEGEHTGTEDTGTESQRGNAQQELFEAIDHFRNAASMFFERATQEPAVRNAANEAERMFHKLGERAEPLARQLTGEVSRLTRRVQDSIEGRGKTETPPPDDDATR